jgi:hypothetical protein
MTRQKSASFRIGSLKKTYLICYQSAFAFSGILYLLTYRLFLRRALMFFLSERKKTNKKNTSDNQAYQVPTQLTKSEI